MIPLRHDPHDTFRFADDRIIPRFHLEGVEAGVPVDVLRIDPATGGRLGPLTTGVVGDGGWVDVVEPIIVRAGDAFVAVPGERVDARPPEQVAASYDQIADQWVDVAGGNCPRRMT